LREVAVIAVEGGRWRLHRLAALMRLAGDAVGDTQEV
jgi:hypothetical protein